VVDSVTVEEFVTLVAETDGKETTARDVFTNSETNETVFTFVELLLLTDATRAAEADLKKSSTAITVFLARLCFTVLFA
jgi:hypothetical protein